MGGGAPLPGRWDEGRISYRARAQQNPDRVRGSAPGTQDKSLTTYAYTRMNGMEKIYVRALKGTSEERKGVYHLGKLLGKTLKTDMT